MTTLVCMARLLGAAVRSAFDEIDQTLECADIKVTKPYKRRRIKTDTIHRMARVLYRMKMRNPAERRKRQLYQKVYRRKNKQALERRNNYVRDAKKRTPPVHNPST